MDRNNSSSCETVLTLMTRRWRAPARAALAVLLALSLNVFSAAASPMECGLEFDGVDDTVVCPLHPALDLTAAISISAWVRLDARLNYRILLWKIDTYGLGYGLPAEQGLLDRFSFHIKRGGVWRAVYSTAPAVLGEWYHLVGTFDGTVLRLYINGALNASVTSAGGIDLTTNPVVLGHLGASYDAPQGGLDEAAIWDRALTPTEVAGLYNSGTGSEVAPSASTRLILHLNETNGQLAYDASGNNIHARLGSNPGLDSRDPQWSCPAETPARFGCALSFDGTRNGVIIPNRSSLNITGPLTVEAWVRRTGENASLRLIAARWGDAALGTGSWGFCTTGTSELPLLRVSNNGTNVTDIVGTVPLPLNIWVHMAGVYDGSYLRIYMNGEQAAAPVAYSLGLYNNGLETRIGDYYYRGAGCLPLDQVWIGEIDEVRISNVARSQAEIRAGLAGELTPDGQTALLMHLNEGSGTTVADASAQGNHGTIAAPTWSCGGPPPSTPTPAPVPAADSRFGGALVLLLSLLLIAWPRANARG